MSAPSHEHYVHPAAWPESRLLRECDFRQGRGSGPGGQHRNKVETLVMLTHTPTGLKGQAGERRTMSENRKVAIRRLRLELAVHHREPVPLGEIGSELWRSRREAPARGNPNRKDPDPLLASLNVKLPDPESSPRGGGRIRCNPKHDDYPALLAEAMDVLAACEWEPREAGLRLDVSQSQLVKLIAKHPPAFGRVNEERERLDRHPLRMP